jgi:hypothetical protein
MQKAAAYLVESGILRGSVLVPNAIAPIDVTADVRSGQITCSVSVPAPGQAKATTRVNWLTRQLPKAPGTVLLEAWNLWAKSPGPCRSLADVRGDPRVLIEDPKKEIRSFTVRLSAPAGTKRGQGKGSFVGSVLELVERFYAEVVQHLKPWTDPAPSVRPVLPTTDDGVADDAINGELPIRSNIRPVPTAESSAKVELDRSPLALAGVASESAGDSAPKASTIPPVEVTVMVPT